MTKLLKPKPNILERLRAKNRPNDNKASVMPKDKGVYSGSCNRSACLKPGSAYWYNHGTSKYYCEQCADWLNTDRFNKRDALEMWGHDLCTMGEYDEKKYEKIHDLHRNAVLNLKMKGQS